MLSACKPSFSAVLNTAPFPTLYYTKKKILSGFLSTCPGEVLSFTGSSFPQISVYITSLRGSYVSQVFPFIIYGCTRPFLSKNKDLKLSHTELNSISLCHLYNRFLFSVV